MKRIFIAWVHPGYESRTDLLARYLDATTHYIYFGQQGKLLQLPVRYLVQAWQTWRVLRRERPDVVFTQIPPIFCALVVAIYCWSYGARYAIDSHTEALVSRKWRWSHWLHRLLSRRAIITLLHNEHPERIAQRWAGCRCSVLAYIPADYPPGESYPVGEQFSVAVVSSFSKDEPIGVVFEAASRLPEVCFFVTGNPDRIPSHLLKKKPANCRLTGYLPNERYVGLLRAVDAIMVLTTMYNYLLMGGFEAISLGKPFITSDWPLLRNHFSQGTVYIPNTAEGVCEGVRRAQQELPTLQRDILFLRQQLNDEWEQKHAELRSLLTEA
jgi:glycosyltransferase involved in cell wall biosynthesis